MFAPDPLGAEPIATSHWTIAAPPLDAAPPLAESVESDVAVIGAGYTGLIAALHLAEAGLRVVIVEAEQPGWGASGRNTGQVVPTMWGMHKTPRQVEERFGRERGAQLNRRVGAAAG
jgi:glycine/D-amino acid oxidase-like deaminating enzyme